MSHEKIKHNKNCKGPSHDRHLCYFVSQGFHLTDAEDYHAMVIDPKFKCKTCGRVANSEDNLCEPEQM